jgi:hypothetical protein
MVKRGRYNHKAGKKREEKGRIDENRAIELALGALL